MYSILSSTTSNINALNALVSVHENLNNNEKKHVKNEKIQKEIDKETGVAPDPAKKALYLMMLSIEKSNNSQDRVQSVKDEARLLYGMEIR